MEDYEYDENKNRSNREKHGFDLRDAALIPEDDYLIEKLGIVKGELREMWIGRLYGYLVTAIVTRRNGAIRVISLRRARDEERQKHKKVCGG